MQPRGLLGQLPVVTGRRQGELADVELDVEVRVLDPVGLVEPERDLDQPAAERRDQVQPGLDEPGQPVERERLGSGRRVEDADAADVAVDRRRLHREEGRVEAGELLHGRCLPGSPFVGPYPLARPTISATMAADIVTSGSPPPGCADPPTRNSPSTGERFAGRRNAARAPLLDVP